MGIEFWVHPNPGLDHPKVWGYELEPGGIQVVYFGSINKTYTKKPVKGSDVRDTARKKESDGYVEIGRFSNISEAQKLAAAYNAHQAGTAFSFDPNDSNARVIADCLGQLGMRTIPLSTPAPASNPQPAPKQKKPRKSGTNRFLKAVKNEQQSNQREPFVLDF